MEQKKFHNSKVIKYFFFKKTSKSKILCAFIKIRISDRTKKILELLIAQKNCATTKNDESKVQNYSIYERY